MTRHVVDHPQLVGLRDIADILGVSPRTVLRLIDAGTIPFLRVGVQYRFNPQAVIEALETVE